jgi:hypothetical protein
MRQRMPTRRDTTKPGIFDLYQHVADVVSPPEQRYAELNLVHNR